MNHLWMDLKYAWRTAKHSLGTTFVILILLALGTGGAAAVFNSIYSLVWAPPPFPQSDRLVVINENVPIFDIYRNIFVENDSLECLFSSLAAYVINPSIDIVSYGKEYKQIRIVSVTKDFFETLGVLPLYGSDYRRIEHQDGIVISNRFWLNELSGSKDVIGRRISYGAFDEPIIMGIMPDTFDFPVGADGWMYHGDAISGIGGEKHFFGRLRDEITIEQARRELKALKDDSQTELTENGAPIIRSFNSVFYDYDNKQNLLWMLAITAILFFLTICCGIMSILIIRGTHRKAEMSIRMSMGATRSNLFFKLMRESFPVVITGTLVGFLISESAGAWLSARYPMLRGGEIIFSDKIVFFAVMILFVYIAGALIPALYISNSNLYESQKSYAIIKRRFYSLTELLHGIQLGLTLALLISAGLLLRSTMFKVDFPVGDTPRAAPMMLVLDVLPPLVPSKYPPKSFTGYDRYGEEFTSRLKERMNYNSIFYRDFESQLKAMPEVAGIGTMDPIPFSKEAKAQSQFTLSVSTERMNTGSGIANLNKTIDNMFSGLASPEAFKMLGIPLVAGRWFTQQDVDRQYKINYDLWGSGIHTDTGRVVIISQSLANYFWPRESAIGKTIYEYYYSSEVVGVVQDFYQVAGDKTFYMAVYHPEAIATKLSYLVKLHSGVLMQSFNQRLKALAPGLGYINVQSLSELVSESLADTHLLLQLLSSFALIGIIAAGLGVYGTAVSATISKEREIGIRMALGQQIRDILKTEFRRIIHTILIGLTSGLFLAWVMSRILSGFIVQLTVDEPFIWISSCALLIGIAIVSAVVPAIRTTRLNPANALRGK